MSHNRRSTDKYLLHQSTHRMFGELRADLGSFWLAWIIAWPAVLITGALWAVEIHKGLNS